MQCLGDTAYFDLTSWISWWMLIFPPHKGTRLVNCQLWENTPTCCHWLYQPYKIAANIWKKQANQTKTSAAANAKTLVWLGHPQETRILLKLCQVVISAYCFSRQMHYGPSIWRWVDLCKWNEASWSKFYPQSRGKVVRRWTPKNNTAWHVWNRTLNCPQPNKLPLYITYKKSRNDIL